MGSLEFQIQNNKNLQGDYNVEIDCFEFFKGGINKHGSEILQDDLLVMSMRCSLLNQHFYLHL